MKCSNTFKVGLVVIGSFLYLFGNTDKALANIIADSVSEFSGTQGQDNWYYGYYVTPGDSSSWEQMLYYDPFGHEGAMWLEDPTNNWYGAHLLNWGGHPRYPDLLYWAVRRWISEVSGDIIVSGTVAENCPLIHGDGVNTIIYMDGVEVWSHYVPPTPGYEHAYEFTVPNVSVGSIIDFAIDPRGNSWYDGTIFTAQIVAEPILVTIDIKPGSCPNPLNVKSKGVLPAAILGSEEFDVATIDAASIRLAGVSPIRSSYEDVATPVSDGADECECTTEGPDGYLDLTLKFETQEIVAALGEIDDGDILSLTLTGLLFDETSIEGADCVVIIKKDSKKE